MFMLLRQRLPVLRDWARLGTDQPVGVELVEMFKEKSWFLFAEAFQISPAYFKEWFLFWNIITTFKVNMYISDPPLNCTRPNEIFGCGGACQNDCNTLGVPCEIQNIVCNRACYCIDGYARDCDCKCVSEKVCPPKNSCTKKCRYTWNYNDEPVASSES